MPADFAPCPTCGRYSHSIEHDDAVAAAFNHFHAMFSHRGDGIPTQHVFDEATRDAAQLLTSYVREIEAENTRLRSHAEAMAEYLEWLDSDDYDSRDDDAGWGLLDMARSVRGREG